MLSPMTLKNGLSSVNNETPIVPFNAARVTPDGVSDGPHPNGHSSMPASTSQNLCFMTISVSYKGVVVIQDREVCELQHAGF